MWVSSESTENECRQEAGNIKQDNAEKKEKEETESRK